MVTLPLSLQDNFDCLLLGLASEIVEEVKFYRMVEITCDDLSQSNCPENIMRVIAAASDNARTKLFPAHDDFLRENALRTLLTSIAVGNVSAVTRLLARTQVALSDTPHAEGSIYIGKTLTGCL